MCGLSTVVTPAGASLTMYREIRSYANSIWDDNNNNRGLGCCCCCFLTLTDPLRIQPWSQDRRNQTKSNRESENLDEHGKHTEKDGQVNSKMCISILTVCVFVFSSHPFWTSSSLDVPAGVTQEEGHTGFLIHLPSAVRALIFVARRIQPFLSLVDREVEFCVLTN